MNEINKTALIGAALLLAGCASDKPLTLGHVGTVILVVIGLCIAVAILAAFAKMWEH